MSGVGSRVARQLLPAQPSSVRAARHALRAWLDAVDRPELSESAELAVSEVVTNALVHAGTPVEVTARLADGFVRVEVADGNAHLPRAREVDSTSGTGRGLTLLDHTVDRWGADVRAVGKVVWFELGHAVTPTDPPAIDVSGAALSDPGAVVVVELLDVPLLLISAWFEHAAALLREHLLVRLDEGNAGPVLERHAAAGEVLSLLAEQWPQLPELEEGGVLATAIEPHVTAPRLFLRVPIGAIGSFTVLDEVLDDALALADSGLLLTPPTQPEMREMRRWLTREVTHQARGAAPRGRTESGPLTGPVSSQSLLRRVTPGWDPIAVDTAVAARVAADDTNRIIAASGAALALLGRERRALVGSRLLEIIPERFHQAHLAGFALHLVNGRGPLLGAPVTVPVRLADDTEQLVELTIVAHKLPGGRSVFVADLRRL